MKLPRGQLLRQRVVSDLGTALSAVLEEEITGYARLEPQDTLLLDTDGVGVLTFVDGVPVVAYHTGTDTAGPAALDEIAVTGPYRIELYKLEERILAEIHEDETLLVAPTLPAERLVGDPALIDRTRDQAPASRLEAHNSPDSASAVESFLSDEQRIETIKQRARADARAKAKQWGFTPEQTEQQD